MSISQADIARQLGVSQRAVSFALNGKPGVSEEMRRRIREVATQKGYRPNAAARAMVQRRTGQIGVLVPNNPGDRFTHPLAYETILGINEGLQKAGLIAVLARIDDVRKDLAEQSRVFKEHVLDGMIVLDSMPPDVEQELEGLVSGCVWCDSNVWRDRGCVRRDERLAGELAGGAAVGLGYRDVYFLGYEPKHAVHYSFAERLAGVRSAVSAAGLPLGQINEPRIGDARSAEGLEPYLRRDAVIITNSIYQAQTLRTVAESLNRRPGHDYGLISCDDMHQLDRMWPGLSRVTFDRYEMGLRAAEMAVGLVERGLGACDSVKVRGAWHAGDTAWGPVQKASDHFQ